MQAVILAAGMGSRLKELTSNNTKCMIKVNGITLIERMLRQIDQHHLDRIVIVTGYEGEKLRNYISTLNISTPIEYIDNPIYDKTNNIYSLALAKDYLLQDDTLLFESDLIFEDSVLSELIDDPRSTLALVDEYAAWMDGTVVKLDEDDRITAFIPGTQLDYSDKDSYYKTVNIYKFSQEFSTTHYIPFLEAYTKALGQNEYYEQVLRVIALLDDAPIKGKPLHNQKWYEIDDVQDLDIAQSIFHPDPIRKKELFEERYGGYWRYPKLRDFCYLVNPYYPPQRMKEEIKASFDTLIADYPSGMKVNSLLAAKNFDVRSDQIVVGNGAAELIKSLVEKLPGRLGIIRPTFEEYPNRLPEEPVVFVPDNKNFSYTADDIINFFDDKNIGTLVVINPDNPSGNFLNNAQMTRLLQWTQDTETTFIVDESFIDFSDEPQASLLNQSLLADNPHLIVIKSISKSFGVAGLRLGILASGNTDLISQLKKDVAIWNINSFAEFYLQIEEKYRKNYVKALEKFRTERKRFTQRLEEVDFLRTLPSQANFITCEVLPPHTAEGLTAQLLDHSIFVKDLSKKKGFGGGCEYIRLAIRDTADNDYLVDTLLSLK